MAAAVVILGAGVARLSLGFRSAAIGGDQISPEEIARRAAFAGSLAPIQVAPVPPGETRAAIAAMPLPEPARVALVSDVATDRTRLVRLTFFDSDVEDGDVIAVRSGGLVVPVRLTKAPVAIALPMPPSGRVSIQGLVDGAGGGVTVGIVTAAGAVPLAVLSVGQTITIPVAS